MKKKDLAPERLRELRAAFQQFDVDGNGVIDRAELGAMLASLDPLMSSEETDIGFSIIDRNRNGRVSFDEFVAWWTER